MGVFLGAYPPSPVRESLPHARGGVSLYKIECSGCSKSSPRSWGCFFVVHGLDLFVTVFPTLVGVFLLLSDTIALMMRLPHARGGVSEAFKATDLGKESSPRSWGCFSHGKEKKKAHVVFPTLVGVFPGAGDAFPCRRCLPHARGGVSSPL